MTWMDSAKRDGEPKRNWGAVYGLAVLVLIFSFAPPPAVASVTDVPVLTSRVLEAHPVAGAGFIAWVQNSRAHPDHNDVYVKPNGGSKIKVNQRDTEASLGAIDGTTLVYQQFKRESNIKFFNLKTHNHYNPPRAVNTQDWEYWPAFQSPWLMFARQHFSFGRWGRRTIILFNLQNQKSRVLDVVGRNDLVLPGQINGGFAVWVHLVPPGRARIYVYDIVHRTLTKIPNARGYDWAPSVTTNGTVYFERSGRRCGSNARILRYPRGGPLATVQTYPSGIDMGTTYVSPLDDGTIQVFHDRLRCSGQRFGWDVYRLVDDYTTTLSVTVAGSGTVTSSPAGITCALTCSHEFEPTQTVILTATPGTGSTFVGWSDPSCPGTVPCTVATTSDTSVTATFTP